MGRFGRLVQRLTSPAEELQNEDLRKQSADSTCTPISDVHDRALVRCRGMVRSVSLRPRTETVPALVVDFDDGHRAMSLVWLGRRSIPGITPGVFMTIEGRVCMRRGVPTVFNPVYTLHAAPGQ